MRKENDPGEAVSIGEAAFVVMERLAVIVGESGPGRSLCVPEGLDPGQYPRARGRLEGVRGGGHATPQSVQTAAFRIVANVLLRPSIGLSPCGGWESLGCPIAALYFGFPPRRPSPPLAITSKFGSSAAPRTTRSECPSLSLKSPCADAIRPLQRACAPSRPTCGSCDEGPPRGMSRPAARSAGERQYFREAPGPSLDASRECRT